MGPGICSSLSAPRTSEAVCWFGNWPFEGTCFGSAALCNTFMWVAQTFTIVAAISGHSCCHFWACTFTKCTLVKRPFEELRKPAVWKALIQVSAWVSGPSELVFPDAIWRIKVTFWSDPEYTETGGSRCARRSNGDHSFPP